LLLPAIQTLSALVISTGLRFAEQIMPCRQYNIIRIYEAKFMVY